jgi:DNA-binding MarR family transcriptional regulator
MKPSSPLAPLYRRPGWLLHRCHQVAVSIFVDSCRKFGLRPRQYGCLRVLEAYPKINQLTLGRLTGLDRSTVGLVIKNLHRRGLITRVVDPRDRRRFSLKLSAAGRRTLRNIAPAVAEAQAKVLGALPRQERSKFVDMLQLFIERHDAAIDVAAIMNNGKAASPPTSPGKRAMNGQRGGMRSRRSTARSGARRRRS